MTVGDAEASTTFKGELSKLDSIEFTSDYAIVKGELGSTNEAYTYYVAKNQWKEDITNSTSLVANSSATNTVAAKGKITFTFGSVLTAASLNDPLTVVVYDSTTAVSNQKTLTITNKALVGTIEPYGTNGIYNANGKTLAVTDKYTESFYYLFRAQDQYGNYLDDPSYLTNANGFYPSYTAGLTNLGIGSLTTKVVDGVTYFAYPLITNTGLKAGTATLILVAGGSGKSVNAQIEVSAGNTVETITVTAPTTVALGDNDVAFDYVALDKDGNEVTSYAQLSKVKVDPQGTPATYGFYWTKKDGKAVLCYNTNRTGTTLPATIDTTVGQVVTATFLTETYKSSIVTFNVKQARYPAEIVGLADNVANAQLVGRTFELKAGDFKVYDQYGDKFDIKNKPYGIKAELKIGNAFVANGTYGSPAYYKQDSSSSVTAPAYASNDLAISQSASGKATSFNLKAVNPGESTYEFSLVARGTSSYTDLSSTLDGTTKNITKLGSKKISFTASTSSKFVSYEVTGPELLYVTDDKDLDGTHTDYGTPSEFEPSIKVYGIDNTGAKVQLTTSDYKISGGANVSPSTGAKLTADITDQATYEKYFKAANSTLDGSYLVTMNDGSVVEKTVTLSNAAPAVASLKLTNGQTYLAPSVAVNAAYILSNIEGKDNYGFDVVYSTTSSGLLFKGNTGNTIESKAGLNGGVKIYATITASDFVYAESNVQNNGSDNPNFGNVIAGDKFTVTVASGKGSVSVPVIPANSSFAGIAYSNLLAATLNITAPAATTTTTSVAITKGTKVEGMEVVNFAQGTAVTNAAIDTDATKAVIRVTDESQSTVYAQMNVTWKHPGCTTNRAIAYTITATSGQANGWSFTVTKDGDI
ncbi:MAG: hypothetical protein ACI4EE_00150 [Lachnospiraceae bacterium]